MPRADGILIAVVRIKTVAADAADDVTEGVAAYCYSGDITGRCRSIYLCSPAL